MSFVFQIRSGGGSVSIPKGMDQTSSVGKSKNNTIVRDCADGTRLGYSQGPNILYGNLVFKMVTKADADAFKNWLVDQVQFTRCFTITPNSVSDIGNELGVKLFYCYWNGSFDTREYIRPRGVGNRFDIDVPYYSLDVIGSGSGLGEI